MPLVLISGHPCSGKSQAAAQLAALLTGAGQHVIIVDEQSLQLNRNESYKGLWTPPPPRHPAPRAAPRRVIGSLVPQSRIFSYRDALELRKLIRYCDQMLPARRRHGALSRPPQTEP